MRATPSDKSRATIEVAQMLVPAQDAKHTRYLRARRNVWGAELTITMLSKAE